MHNQVRVGDATVDLSNTIDGEDVARGLARELVGPMTRANRNGQGIELGLTHEVRGLLWVGEELVGRHGGVGAMAVFLVAAHGLQRPKAAEFTLHRDALGMGHGHHGLGHLHVVVVAGNGLAIGLQRAIHHDAGKAKVHGALADLRTLAVILVHDNRQVRVALNGSLNEVPQEGLSGVLSRARTGLHDHRGIHGIGRRQNGLDLFQVVHVKGGNAVTVLGGVVEQLPQGHQGHLRTPFGERPLFSPSLAASPN